MLSNEIFKAVSEHQRNKVSITPQPYLSADMCKCLEIRSHKSLV